MPEPIRIDGLAQFTRDLRKLDKDLPKAVRIALNEAAEVVVGAARPRVPKRSGRAAASIKARSTRTAVRVVGGGARVSWFPWLEFGGRVGRNKSVRRAYLKEGRFLFPALSANRDEFEGMLTRALIDVARQAGVEVEG